MVCLWGFRLGGYLFYRILIWGEDHRFDKMRERFWSFLGFWIMQILWVFLLSLPVTYFNGMTGNFELTNLSYIGIIMFGIGATYSVSVHPRFCINNTFNTGIKNSQK